MATYTGSGAPTTTKPTSYTGVGPPPVPKQTRPRTSEEAIGDLSDWQQKLFANQDLEAIQKNNPKAWAAYQAGLAMPVGEEEEQAMAAQGFEGSGYTSPLSTATPKGTPRRDLYASMGGKKGTNMDFKEFKAWYDEQSKALGGDLSSYLGFSGVQAGSLADLRKSQQKGGGGATGATLPYTAGADILGYRGEKALSDEGELFWLNRQLGKQYGTLEEAKNAIALGAGMAGVQQFNTNLLGKGGEALPGYLRDVSAQDIRYDPHSYELTLAHLLGGTPEAAQRDYAAWQEAVPDWAYGVDEKLRSQEDINREGVTGIPFGFEMLMDPSLNLTDPNAPLFGGGIPARYLNITGGQGSEADIMRSASMQEIMSEWWPIINAQYNRPAGSPAPFGAGLTFGSPQYTNESGAWGYQRSPLMGYGGDDFRTDPDLIRLEGYAGKSVPENELYRNVAGGIYPRYQAQEQIQYLDDWNKTREQFGLPPETVEDYWSYPEYQPFRNLDPETLARIMAVMNSPTGSGASMTVAGQVM